jgi:hypothetical protein
VKKALLIGVIRKFLVGGFRMSVFDNLVQQEDDYDDDSDDDDEDGDDDYDDDESN